jgi:hypothetical protein
MLVSIVMRASTYMCGLFTGCISTYIYINYNNIYEKAQEDAIVLGYKTMQLYTNIKEHATVKRIAKICQWLYINTIQFIYNNPIEPPGSFWIYSCSLVEKYVPIYDSLLNGSGANDFKKHKYTLEEKYNELEDDNMYENFVNYKPLILNSLPQLDLLNVQRCKLLFLTNAQLYIIKLAEYYIIRRAENNASVDVKKSKYGFLSVEYLHPNQKEPVVLNINKNMCMEGNELFTPEFVLRTLIYQNVDYHFDLNYKIRIMDNNINMFELNSSQYIELTEKSYIVHSHKVESQKE